MDSEQVRYLFYHELTHITTTFCVPGCRGISLVVHPVPHFLEGIDDFTEILDYLVRHGVPFSYILAMR